MRKYLRTNPHLFTKVKNGIPIYSQNMMPVQGLNTCKTLPYDTYENRYVKWMIERLIYKLTDLMHQIISEDHRWKRSPDEALIANIERKISQLKQQLNHPFWSNIGTLDQFSMSLVLQMAPGYRDAFQIYLTVSRGLMLQGTFYRMSMKDIARLYEYWTFLKLNSILAKRYTLLRQNLVQVNNNGLYVYLLENRNAKNVFEHPVTKEKIVLSYQNSHASLPTTAQEPDTMLRIEKKGKDYTFNYIFDAKYRIDYAQEGSTYQRKYESPGPMEGDINTMHRYRDAIVAANDGEYERTSFGAYVLFPWHDEHKYQQHHFYQSIDQVNIGGLPFLPDATKLVETFVERLIDKSPEEIHQEGILPKGAKEIWKFTLDDKVLVGLVATTNHYKTFIQGKYYAFSAKQLKQNWHEVNYVALYLSKDVTETNGVKVYGKINNIIVEDETVYFYVHQWVNLPSVIKPVGYGIGNYIITTLNALKEAKELPELFMKNKADMILWRMLQRIADQIKLELDTTMMDDASRIMKYRIKNITIICDERKSILLLTNLNERKIFAFDDLYKNPSYVFKQLVKMLYEMR